MSWRHGSGSPRPCRIRQCRRQGAPPLNLAFGLIGSRATLHGCSEPTMDTQRWTCRCSRAMARASQTWGAARRSPEFAERTQTRFSPIGADRSFVETSSAACGVSSISSTCETPRRTSSSQVTCATAHGDSTHTHVHVHGTPPRPHPPRPTLAVFTCMARPRTAFPLTLAPRCQVRRSATKTTIHGGSLHTQSQSSSWMSTRITTSTAYGSR